MCVYYDIVNIQIFQWSLASIISMHVRGRLPPSKPSKPRCPHHITSSALNISKCQASGGARRGACGSAASPAARGRSPTSVGRLISNRSSRLAFQWLMMSASFLLSSSLLPDMVDSVFWLSPVRLHC